MRLPILSLLLPLGLACSAPEQGDYSALNAAKQDNAAGSRYQVPPDVRALGDIHDVAYTGAGSWNGSSSCQGSMTPGAEALLGYLEQRYPQITSIGGYSCRHINGRPSQTSVHATGRALDIMLPVGFRAEADNRAGDPIGNFLIANAEEIGIQYMIWDRTSWGAHRPTGDKERYYSGAHPHNDHLHVELSVEAGDAQTPWLLEGWQPIELDASEEPAEPPPASEPTPEPTPIDELPEEPTEDPPEEPAPSTPPLGDPLPEEPRPSGLCAAVPADGAVLDESSNCIWLRGPANYWNHEAEGHDSALAWTNALQSGKHLSYAEWELSMLEEGVYDIEVFVVPEFATHIAARYYVQHASATTETILDLSSGDGWIKLGSYAFAAGGDQKITIFDNSDQAVAEDQRIMVDAIRITPHNEEPDTEEPGSNEPEPEEPGEPEPEEPGTDGTDGDAADGLVTSGCQVGSSGTPWTSALLMLLSLVALGRRRRE